jgi:hypothetical protein
VLELYVFLCEQKINERKKRHGMNDVKEQIKEILKTNKKLYVFEPIFRICSAQHIDALVLARLLRGDFIAPKAYPIEKFCKDLFLSNSNRFKIINAIKRLKDKGYVIEASSNKKRGGESTWQIDLNSIQRDLQKLDL